MSPEAQRIAIAEACGWTNIHKFNKWKEGGPASTRDGDIVGDFGEQTRSHLPNFLGCLNAIHEAEKALTDHQYSVFWDKVEDLQLEALPIGDLKTPSGESFGIAVPVGQTRSLSATAAQRAEAMIKTLNKWDDSK